VTEDEACDVLASVFGDDWEWFLAAEGVMGGAADTEIEVDRRRVVDLARGRAAEGDLDYIGEAWFALWLHAPDLDRDD
jgi:hypothetical protein